MIKTNNKNSRVTKTGETEWKCSNVDKSRCDEHILIEAN